MKCTKCGQLAWLLHTSGVYQINTANGMKSKSYDYGTDELCNECHYKKHPHDPKVQRMEKTFSKSLRDLRTKTEEE